MPRPRDAIECVRQLIHVPILHSPAEMGAMGEKLVAAYIERFGRRHWGEYLAAIQDFWPAVRAELDRLDLDYRRVDLYQDGLPVCGRELEIVQKAAAMGGENYQWLLDLLARGATLWGTEDPDLLLREYRDVQAALAQGPGEDKTTAAKASNDAGLARTLTHRDAYIGRRIDETLQPGRTGILFLGMTHNIESFLPADVVVRRLASAAGRQKEK